MIDKRIGKRIKEYREKLGLTQDQFSEKIGLSVNYISTVERGGSFPRYEKLIKIINGLEVSADAIFCDVINNSVEYKENEISRRLSGLPTEEQRRILEMLDLMIQRQKTTNSDKFIPDCTKIVQFFIFCPFLRHYFLL